MLWLFVNKFFVRDENLENGKAKPRERNKKSTNTYKWRVLSGSKYKWVGWIELNGVYGNMDGNMDDGEFWAISF